MAKSSLLFYEEFLDKVKVVFFFIWSEGFFNEWNTIIFDYFDS